MDMMEARDKRKLDFVLNHDWEDVSQVSRSKRADGSFRSPFDGSEREEGKVSDDIRRSSRIASRDRDTPRLATKGYPSISQGQRLCESCSSLDFNEIRPGPGIWKTTAVKLGTLSQFTVDPNCLLCQLFASMASLAYAPTTSDSQSLDEIVFYLCSFHTSAMYSHNWRSSRTIRGLEKSVSYAVIDEHVLHDQNESFSKERKMSHALWPSRTSIERSGWLSPAAQSSGEQRFAARILSSQADLNVPKRWLDFCLEHHEENCEPVDTRPIPALHVVDSDTGKVISAELGCKYLAMSYVWGTAPIDELEKDGSLLTSSTPVLIRDALAATKKLGFRYLWIDRYCIPQSDGKERHSQIQQMDLIYSKAQATIFAVSSRDPSHGLPGVGERVRASSVSFNIGDETYSYVPPHPMAEICGSVWNNRGWTHQETILSRRRIFFCKHQIYFECAGMRCHDTMQAPLQLLHTKELRLFSKWNRPSLFARVRQTKDPLTAVFDHITIYTGRNLTRPDDILNGIMGTFHAFESVYDFFRHYWGTPMVPDITFTALGDQNPRRSTRTEQFLTGLCWQLSRPGNRRQGFPSWSWAGWYGTLKAHREENGYIKNTYGVKVWIDSIFTSQMDLGTFCDSTAMDVFPSKPEPFIIVEAEFFQVQFRLAARASSKENEVETWEVVIETGHKRAIYAPFHITRHTSVGDKLHSKISRSPFSAFILGERLKTQLHPSTKKKLLNRSTSDMVIVVVDEVDNDMIERIGIIKLGDSEEKAQLEAVSKHRSRRKYG